MPPTKVRMPDGKVISFPDGTPPDEMQAALAGYGKPQPTTADNSVENPPDEGMVSKVVRGARGAADRAGGYITGALPHSLSDVVGGPASGYGIAKSQFQNFKGAMSDITGGKPARGVIQGVAPGLGTGSLYDMSASGKTPEAVGAGGVDALSLLISEAPKIGPRVANAAADTLSHPVVRNLVEAPTIRKAVAGKLMDWATERAARGSKVAPEPGMLSIGETPGVRVAPEIGGDAPPPRIPSPAEDLVSALEQGKGEVAQPPSPTHLHGTSLDRADSILNEGIVPNKTAPWGVSEPGKVYLTDNPEEAQHYADNTGETPVGGGTAVFGVDPDVPVSRGGEYGDLMHDGTIPPSKVRLLHAISDVIKPPSPRSMQPTGDMASGGGGANYSADDLASLISKHNIPPAPGEIVGAATPPKMPFRPMKGISAINEHPNYPRMYSDERAITPVDPTNPDLLASQLNLSNERLSDLPKEGGWDPNDPDIPTIVKDSAGRQVIVDGHHRLSIAHSSINRGIPIDPDRLQVAMRTPGSNEFAQQLGRERPPRADREDDAAMLQAMREDLDAHGRNALHEESTDFAARNKVNRPKVGKPGYGWKRKLPEAE